MPKFTTKEAYWDGHSGVCKREAPGWPLAPELHSEAFTATLLWALIAASDSDLDRMLDTERTRLESFIRGPVMTSHRERAPRHQNLDGLGGAFYDIPAEPRKTRAGLPTTSRNSTSMVVKRWTVPPVRALELLSAGMRNRVEPCEGVLIEVVEASKFSRNGVYH